MENKIDWKIHCVSNNRRCDICRKPIDDCLPYLCNAHTHGMEKYRHPDFQLVLNLGMQEICRILNEMGRRVQAGQKFSAGDMVKGIYLDCDVRLDRIEETEREVLRIIIPDKNCLFPEDPLCTGIYPQQLYKTEELYISGDKDRIRVRLYQVSPLPEGHNLIFKDAYTAKQSYNGRIPSELYECVFDGNIAVTVPEEVFRIFNTEHPKGYTARSMSVSDVVEFEYQNGRKIFYYCDTVGFTSVDFESDKAKNNSPR